MCGGVVCGGGRQNCGPYLGMWTLFKGHMECQMFTWFLLWKQNCWKSRKEREYVRKAFKGVQMINETLFQAKGSDNEQEGKDLEKAKVIESGVHDCCLNVEHEGAGRVDVNAKAGLRERGTVNTVWVWELS